MSTPTKRRKKNDYQPPSQPVKSLDFFFGKQRERQGEKEALKSTGSASNDQVNISHDERLTDEELARKLQAEWDEEERLNRSDRAPIATANAHDEGSELDLSNVKPAQEQQTVASTAEAVAEVPKPSSVGSAATARTNILALQPATAEDDAISYAIPFDQSPLTFDPQKYLPDLLKNWSAQGGKCTYSLLTSAFVLVGGTTSRITIVDTLVNLLRTLIEGDPESLLPAVWLATNSISPPYIDVELGLGGSAISKALKKVCGLDNSALKSLYNKHGDAGDVAYEAKKKQSFTLRKPKLLTIKGVYESLHKIANAKGQGSQEAKQRLVERLVQDARGAEESRYIVRTLVQHLRIGAVKTTMLIALSRAFLLSRPPNGDYDIKLSTDLAKLSKQELAEVYSHPEEIVKASFARRPNYNDLVPTLLDVGISDELLSRCGLALHIPLRPMLGSITRDLGEMLTKLQGRDFACEFKYDGQRAQVHCDSQGKVSIFSRHLEVMTEKYPDLVELVPKIRGEGVSSFILEGEVVAVDRDTGDLKPFQILANRARKDVVIQSVKVNVCLFAFDLMYLNGEELLDRPFRERRSLLRSLFVEIPHHFTWVQNLDATSSDFEAVGDFFKRATEIKCEGIMVKILDDLPNPELHGGMDMDGAEVEEIANKPQVSVPKGKKGKKLQTRVRETPAVDGLREEKKGGRRKALLSTYEPDKRLDSWLKVKKDYNTQTDTIDLIPVGGWHGQGRKNAWWSPILLACRNPENGSLEVVTKCISGFTDTFYKANRARYDPDHENEDGIRVGRNVLGEKPSYVEYTGHPDVWFEPQEVWEMVFADITISPTYTAAIGLVHEDKGLSLRFPRFLKVRDDKGIEEASTNEFLAELYRKQMVKGPVAEKAEAAVEDDELYD
jgi:DNA ligase-1